MNREEVNLLGWKIAQQKDLDQSVNKKSNPKIVFPSEMIIGALLYRMQSIARRR